jgi:tetratricopeptide (TPR) repeat protein
MSFRSIFHFPLSILLLLPLPAAAQQADVIWLRDETPREGTILQVTREAVTLRTKEGEITLPVADLRPDCAWRLLKARLGEKDLRGWHDLGDFALKSGLHAEALQAFHRVIEIDPSQRAALEPKIEEVRAADAAALFKRAQGLAAEEKYEDALRAYSYLLDKYPASGHAAQAKEELKALAAKIEKQNEERRQRLADAQQLAQEQRAQAGEAAEAQRLARAVRAAEEGQKLFVEGLDHEGKGVTGRAEKAWEAAVAKFEEARAIHLDLQAKAKAPAVQDAARREAAAVTRLLIVTCDSLGQMAATEQSFRDAIRWFNKALALDPTDRVATDLKARITAEQIARRIRVGY